MFLGVNDFSIAGLYREVKCCLPIVFTPPRSKISTWSRYAAFNGANTSNVIGLEFMRSMGGETTLDDIVFEAILQDSSVLWVLKAITD